VVIGIHQGERMKVLITGGAGFIGHHMVEKLAKETNWQITVLDRLDDSGNMNRLSELNLPQGRLRFIYHDLRAEFNNQLIAQIGYHDFIIHMAALTHVDRSIENPMSAVLDNVVGTTNILEFARKWGCGGFLYFSTDEVFGSALHENSYKEWDRYKSGNPYAASKAGAEEMCLAYQNTYNLPVFITHTMNVIGERQHPEKFVPMVIRKVRDGEIVTIHSNSTRTKAGSRFYIHASTVADVALWLINGKGSSGEKYNIVGERELDNLKLAELIAEIQGKELRYEMTDFHSSRPGHDLRYALDGRKLELMGWRHKESIIDSLLKVVKWSLANPRWLMNSSDIRRMK
jgi:dTDP-glucose 4,6-dehydratase